MLPIHSHRWLSGRGGRPALRSRPAAAPFRLSILALSIASFGCYNPFSPEPNLDVLCNQLEEAVVAAPDLVSRRKAEAEFDDKCLKHRSDDADYNRKPAADPPGVEGTGPGE